MNPIDLPFSGVAALALFLAKATLLLIAALVATATLRRSTAGARHLVWLAALVGVLALPLLSRIPSLRLGILPSALAGVVPMLASETPPVPRAESPRDAFAPHIVSSIENTAAAAPAVVGGATGGVHDGVVGGVAGGVASAFSSAAAAGYSILSIIVLAWAFIALALVGWLVAGALSVRRIVTSARELTSPDWTMPLCEVADRLDLEVPPRIVMTDRIEMAFACRALAPTIVLPASAESWTDDRRRAVLFHELAHVKRHDLLGHTLGRLACALYWFHPLVWTAAKRLRAESERACDDLVLTCGARPSEYAQHLLDMVTNVRDLGAPVMSLPMARKKEFEGRMLAILDPAIRRASPGRWQATAVVTALGIVSLTVAAVSPAAATQTGAGAPALARVDSQRSSDPPAPPSLNPTPRRLPASPMVPEPPSSAAPAVSAEVSQAPRGGVSVHVQTGNAQLDGLVNSVTSSVATSVVNGVGTALQQAGAALARQGRLQSADTGRVAMMIKILSTDADAGVRRTAAWGLHDLESPDVRGALMKALRSDTDERVREMSAWALGEQGNAAAGPALSDALLHDKSTQVRFTAAWALGECEARSEVSALESAMHDSSSQVRQVSIWALGQIEDKAATKALTASLTDPDKQVRLVTVWALGQIEDKSTAPAIVAAYKTETDPQIRSAEMRTLAVLGEITPELVEEALKSSDPAVRRRAVGLLAGSSSVEPWPWPMPMPRPMP